MAWVYGALSLICFVVAIGGTVFMKELFLDMLSDGVVGMLLGLFMGAVLLGMGVLGGFAGNESYIRFTTEKVEETITVVTSESRMVMVPVVISTGKTTTTTFVPTWYTDITCEEYSGEFTAAGSHDWPAGTKVTITFYVQDGERIRYDL